MTFHRGSYFSRLCLTTPRCIFNSHIVRACACEWVSERTFKRERKRVRKPTFFRNFHDYISFHIIMQSYLTSIRFLLPRLLHSGSQGALELILAVSGQRQHATESSAGFSAGSQFPWPRVFYACLTTECMYTNIYTHPHLPCLSLVNILAIVHNTI